MWKHKATTYYHGMLDDKNTVHKMQYIQMHITQVQQKDTEI